MRLRRPFSSSILRGRQTLFEPYVAPLNQEQLKAIRKEAMRDNPKYHRNIAQDADFLHRAFRAGPEDELKRKNETQRVLDVIRGMAPKSEDIEFLDISMNKIALNAANAPLELVIQDKSRPQGFSPDMKEEQYPDYYNPLALAKALTEAGYDGTFVEYRPVTAPGLATSADGFVPPAPLPEPPWSDPMYRPLQPLHPGLPPALRLTSLDHIIILNPPHPSHIHLAKFIRRYCRSASQLSELISTLYLWAKSWGIVNFTPTVLALMAIHFYQQRYGLTPVELDAETTRGLPTTSNGGSSDGFWVMREHRESENRPEFLWVDVPDLDVPKKIYNTRLGPLFYQFLQFWGERGRILSKKNALNVRTGTYVSRQDQHLTKVIDHVMRLHEKRVRKVETYFDPLTQHFLWRYQRLILPDPFLPHHNHAQLVTSADMEYFMYNCAISSRKIKMAHPLTATFGACMTPRHMAEKFESKRLNALRYTRAYHTSASIARQSTLLPPIPKLPPHVAPARSKTISRVQNVIKSKFGQQYTVECFGSTVYGVDSPSSDLDLVILDPQRMTGFSPSVKLKRLPEIYRLGNLAYALGKAKFKVLAVIPNAKVPIVKFRDLTTGINCDINVNEQLGLFNTRLIARYCDLAPGLRRLIFAIKSWAKSHSLNDPSAARGPATFSSYALAIMTIGYLQIKGVLPNLQEGLEELPDDKSKTKGTFWILRKGNKRVRCDYGFKRLDSERQTAAAESLDEFDALTGWFDYWGNHHHYSKDKISIRDGGLLGRQSPQTPKLSELPESEGTSHISQALVKSDETGDVPRISEADDINELHQPSSIQDDLPADKYELVTDRFPEHIASHSGKRAGQLSYVDVNDEDGPPDNAEEHHYPFERPLFTIHEYSYYEDSLDNDELVDRSGSGNPPQHLQGKVFVMDPFIPSKNITSSVGKAPLSRFIADCQRAAMLMRLGAPFESLLGDEGHRGRNEKGRPGRGKAPTKKGIAGNESHASNSPKQQDEDTTTEPPILGPYLRKPEIRSWAALVDLAAPSR